MRLLSQRHRAGSPFSADSFELHSQRRFESAENGLPARCLKGCFTLDWFYIAPPLLWLVKGRCIARVC